MKVGYVLKRYPRYSETFVVNEILAHEAAGLEVEIFALRPPSDAHFQDIISRVRAPVNYLPANGIKASDLWLALEGAAEALPDLWPALGGASGEEPRDVYQAGPHRIEAGWWDDLPAARDYYLASSPRAGLLWVYRTRSHTQAGELLHEQWFLHGLFA